MTCLITRGYFIVTSCLQALDLLRESMPKQQRWVTFHLPIAMNRPRNQPWGVKTSTISMWGVSIITPPSKRWFTFTWIDTLSTHVWFIRSRTGGVFIHQACIRPSKTSPLRPEMKLQGLPLVQDGIRWNQWIGLPTCKLYKNGWKYYEIFQSVRHPTNSNWFTTLRHFNTIPFKYRVVSDIALAPLRFREPGGHVSLWSCSNGCVQELAWVCTL